MERRRAITWVPLWHRAREGAGLEHLLLGQDSADGLVLAFDEQDRPFRLAYTLSWAPSWRLRLARLVVTTEAGARSLALETDGQGRWKDGEGHELPALRGCGDIDIWPTPFTNTFPLRRDPLAVGERREVLVAWVSAPALTVRPARQAYTRLGERRFLYESLEGTAFRAELTVDDDLVVVDYEGVFRRVR